MTADALAPHITKTSAAMVLTMENNQALAFHAGEFQLPTPSQS